MNQSLEQERLEDARHIIRVITYKMAVPLFFIFWLLDLFYVPQLKWEFLALRCLILPAALITAWWLRSATSYHYALQAGLFMMFVCGGILNAMTYIIGKGSLYDVSLQLVAIGGLSFIPWTRGYFILATFLVYVPYYIVQLSHLNKGLEETRLLVNSFFIAGIIIITWLIHIYRETSRQREINMRLDLEKEVAQRKETEQALIVARDQALAATHAKESFLANMSHEIRTPLTAIIGFTEHALDKATSNEERESALKTIKMSSSHLLNIVNDILDFSKIDANSFELEQIKMDPVLLAKEVQSLMLPLSENKKLLIKIVYEFPLPVIIVSDPVRLKQILINLCSNAIKFTEHGAILLTLAYDKEKNTMIYRVKDSGIGMSSEEMERIFVPFKQADTSITRRYGGTGLGLSLSHKLACLLKGDLSVTSEKNIGSEFILTVSAGDELPLEFYQNDNQIRERIEDKPTNTEPSVLHGHVLLAEDNENNKRLLSIYLNKMGLQVTTAENGAVAVEKALNKSFDLILMDMQMPVLSGVDAVEQLRAKAYTGPIIALTANATSRDRRVCLEAGCHDFLTKPVTQDILYNMLVKYLNKEELPERSDEPIYSELIEEEPDIIEVVDRFIENLPEQITKLDTAFYANDWQTFRNSVHDLKGMGGGFGFPQLSQEAAKIETQLQQQNYSAILPMISELKLLVKRIRPGSSKAY